MYEPHWFFEKKILSLLKQISLMAGLDEQSWDSSFQLKIEQECHIDNIKTCLRGARLAFSAS